MKCGEEDCGQSCVCGAGGQKFDLTSDVWCCDADKCEGRADESVMTTARAGWVPGSTGAATPGTSASRHQSGRIRV